MDKVKLLAFMDEVGRHAQGPGTIYLVGGATALLLGIRDQTIDIDLKLDPEPKAIFESIAKIKERLVVNIELAAPDDFIPPLPGWKERSEFIATYGQVEFRHYDFCGQALAKIQRGFTHDLADARDLVRLGKVDLKLLQELFAAVKDQVIRYPAIDADDFERRLTGFVESMHAG